MSFTSSQVRRARRRAGGSGTTRSSAPGGWNARAVRAVGTGMRAIRVERYGGPEVLVVADVEAPRPGPGQVLVDVAAGGVNYVDTYHRSGAYGIPLPFLLGVEGAGTIAEVGEGVTGLSAGDHVAWVAARGSYGEQTLVDADKAIPVPGGVPDELAAAVALQGLTAHYLCTSTYSVRPGDAVLVHAAAGGVGLLLTQMVKLHGGRVLATVSTDEKAALARQAGADEVIRYDRVASPRRSAGSPAGRASPWPTTASAGRRSTAA